MNNPNHPGQHQSMVPQQHPPQGYPQGYPPQHYGQAAHPMAHSQHPGAYGHGYAPQQMPVNVVVQNTMTQHGNPHGGLVRVADRQKGVAVVLALFLGGLGAHRFYLGQTAMGIVYLFFCWTFIPAFIALIEALVLLLMSQREFDLKYNSALA